MPACQNLADVRRFLGMANQLGRFSPRLASLTHPLRKLLSTGSAWVWGPPQQQAFQDCKKELSSPTVLAPYNINFDTRISADASSFGLGAVIRQRQPSGDWRPIAYQSRAMTPTEERYSQIEEALAVTWACERFSHYLLGSTFSIHTDHKPIVPLLSSKPLDTLPPRILRFRLKLMRYHFTISHFPGKDLVIADTLSRAPAGSSLPGDHTLQDEAAACMSVATDSLPASDERLSEFADQQTADPLCSAIATYCREGWHVVSDLPEPLKPY